MAGEDDSDIPETGAVFTFGKSKFAENLPNKFWVRNDKVLHVACGDEHTCLVAESGRVFTFGSNDWGQLGLGSTATANRPSCIKSLKHEKVTLVACGRVHTIVATESGKLYSFGANGEGQLGVDKPDSKQPICIDTLPPTQYKMLTAGADHSAALTMDGRVFVWGGGSEGQLGLGAETTEAPEPTELFMDEDVECIACGYYHTALVTTSGNLFTFGEKDSGKLGHGNDVVDSFVPQPVSLPEKAVKVACGGSHTVVLTKGGSVFTFGDGSNGQLGHGTSLLELSTPERLKFSSTVSKISCGENHTALVSRKGHLFTCGDGRHGKLALGTEGFSNQFTPAKVKRFTKFYVNEVSCGGCHMIALATLKMENGFIESSDSEVEEMAKTKSLNNTLKNDNSLDLSISARERRRQHSSPMPLHRTLPELANNKPLPPLRSTLPKSLDQTALKPIQKPEVDKAEKGSNDKVSKSSETESDEETKPKSVNNVLQNEHNSSKLSPKPVPRPLPRHGKTEKQKDEDDSDSEEKEDETRDSIQKFTPEDESDKLNNNQDDAEKLKTKRDDDDSDSEEEKDEKHDTVQNITPADDSDKLNKVQDDVEKLKTKEGESDEDSDEETEDEEEAKGESARKLPVPQPRKIKSSTEEDEDKLEEGSDEKKDKKKVKKKVKKPTIFGKESGSGEEDEETVDDESEEEDDEKDKIKEDKEEKKEEKEEEVEKKDEKSKKEKKEKEKEKKGKKDKKKDKKTDEEDDDKKDKKDKKKKDKKKKDDKKSEKEEKKLKDGAKDDDEKKKKKKEKGDKEEESEKENKDDKKDDKKEEDKTATKPTKKSRTCTVL